MRVDSVAVSADGKRIVSGSGDKKVKVWDAETGQNLLTLDGHTDQVKGVAVSPDGKRIVSGSGDTTVKVWHAETRRDLTLNGHTNEVNSVAVSRDGKRVLSRDGSGKVLACAGRPATGRLLLRRPRLPTRWQHRHRRRRESSGARRWPPDSTRTNPLFHRTAASGSHPAHRAKTSQHRVPRRRGRIGRDAPSSSSPPSSISTGCCPCCPSSATACSPAVTRSLPPRRSRPPPPPGPPAPLLVRASPTPAPFSTSKSC